MEDKACLTMVFLGVLFKTFIGPEALDYIKMPLGLDLPVGAEHGAGTVVLVEGVKMLAVPLWRSYLAGCILLGIAPCTAMVLVWGYLAKGNDGHTLIMVAINSLTMLFLYGPLGGFLLGIGRLPVPWIALLLSIGIYVALPLVAGFISRKLIIAKKGLDWIAYGLARLLKLSYQDAAPSAMIGASNHFEVAIATSVMLFGLSSGAALATVVGVLT